VSLWHPSPGEVTGCEPAGIGAQDTTVANRAFALGRTQGKGRGGPASLLPPRGHPLIMVGVPCRGAM
jgi:hypothetical protein